MSDIVSPPVEIPWKLIERSLQASEASYKSAWDALTYEHECGAFARLVERVDAIELAWRGTDDAKDWGKNVRAYPWRYGGAWVHRGFMTGHASLWPTIITEIQRIIARRGPLPLIVTGHSYGGALAELTCLFLPSYPAPVSLITFGKPNVFLKPRAERFDFLSCQISVVSGSDGVARIPRVGYGPDLGQAMLYLATRGEQLDYWIPQMDDDSAKIILKDFCAADMKIHHSLTEYRRRLDNIIKIRMPPVGSDPLTNKV